jgi:hypothetical protein
VQELPLSTTLVAVVVKNVSAAAAAVLLLLLTKSNLEVLSSHISQGRFA